MKRLILILLFYQSTVVAQNDLFQLLDDDANYKISSTFKGVKIVNGQSVELVSKSDLLFLIQHRFGTLNSGAYNLYGLDNAQVRFGLDYGVNDWASIGLGRSSFLKNIDANSKIKLFSQSNGENAFPVSLVWYSSVFFKQSIWEDMQKESYVISDQMSYAYQFLVARKINSNLSVQLSPTIVHKNLVNKDDTHDFISVGLATRQKLTSRISVNAEYFLQLNDAENTNTLSLGVDIETGGHVFQLHLSNSAAMFERAFIHETNGSWLQGDIYFGFNISRVFTLAK